GFEFETMLFGFMLQRIAVVFDFFFARFFESFIGQFLAFGNLFFFQKLGDVVIGLCREMECLLRLDICRATGGALQVIFQQNIGAGGDQFFDDVFFAAFCCDMQRSLAAAVGGIGIGFVLDQQIDQIFIAFIGGVVQGGIAVLMGMQVHIRAKIQKDFSNI